MADDPVLSWLLQAAPLMFGRHWPADLAERAKVTRRAVELWRSRGRLPKPEVAERLALLMLHRRDELLRVARALPVEPGSPVWARLFQAPGAGESAALMDRLPGGAVPASWADPFGLTDEEIERQVAAAEALAPLPKPAPEPPAAPAKPKRRGRPPAVTEENIAKALIARGIRVFMAPPPRFQLTREQAAQERLDHAAGKVVYRSELMNYAHLLTDDAP